MFPKKLNQKLQKRIENNSLRKLSSSNDLVDFSSNDYLGFAKLVIIFKESHQHLIDNDIVQNGATGSRLLSGNHELYTKVEKQLQCVHHSEALIFNSGYDANIGFFSAVPQRNDVILYDEYSHASIRDGIKLSNTKAYSFKHNDLADLEKKLLSVRAQSRTNDTEVYVVTESVFSMDGDSPDLMALVNLCKSHNGHLVIDEAHAVGVYGFGLVQKLGFEEEVFARIITFGKAMGCHGAAVLGSKQLKEYLINFSRSFVYTTGLSPHSLATIHLAYKELVISSAPDSYRDVKSHSVVQQLEENIQYFKIKYAELQLNELFIQSNSAIQCCMIPGNSVVKKCAMILQENGFDVRPILSPTVPERQERLRFCLHSYNTHKEIDKVLNLLSTFAKSN